MLFEITHFRDGEMDLVPGLTVMLSHMWLRPDDH